MIKEYFDLELIFVYSANEIKVKNYINAVYFR